MTQALGSQGKSPEAVAHLVALVRASELATLITRSRGGSLHGRPMSIARVEENVTLWFLSSASSTKVEEVAEDARAMVTLQSGGRFVCINGNAELVFDPEQIRALWRDSYRVWCRGGSEQDIVLVRFSSFDAEYWDDSGVHGRKYAFQASREGGDDSSSHELERGREPESHAKLKLWDPADHNEHH